MTEKYYTPSIEEFHVGFEYEFFHNNEWRKQTFSLIDGWPKDLKDSKVKYLDQEDIEGLQWNKEDGKFFFIENEKYIYRLTIIGRCHCLITMHSKLKKEAEMILFSGVCNEK